MANEFLPIKSSNLERGRYNAETRELDIIFQDKKTQKPTHFYRYSGFDPEKWAELHPTFQSEKDSTGTLVRKLVAGLKYERMEIPK